MADCPAGDFITTSSYCSSYVVATSDYLLLYGNLQHKKIGCFLLPSFDGTTDDRRTYCMGLDDDRDFTTTSNFSTTTTVETLLFLGFLGWLHSGVVWVLWLLL